MEIKYLVCGIGYANDDCITDYDAAIGEFTSLDAAIDQLDLVKIFPRLYLKSFPNMGYWMVQIERCEVTEGCIECVDVIDEVYIYAKDLK